jgi:type I restriction enzyme, S subunit
MATTEIAGGNTNQAVAIIRLLPSGLQPQFAVTYLISASAQRLIDQAKVDVARANLSLADIAAMPFPLAPKVEQHRIGRELDRLLSVSDRIAADVGRSLEQCKRLRQSVLKWAFEGRLVDQDPGDEPASALLERIRDESEANGTSRRQIGKRPAAAGRRRSG